MPFRDRVGPPVSIHLRKRIYNAVARKANNARVRWVVLHGIEDYPVKIGRDLDVMCRSPADAARLLEIFSACLRREGFRWIAYPSPVWGRRIIGITDEYHVVELHTIERLRIANVDFKPDWETVEYVEGTFPIERSMAFYKACLISVIGGNDPLRCKSNGAFVPARLPWWLEPAVKQARARGAVTTAAKVILCGGFFVAHPLTSVENSLCWLRTKLTSPFQPLSPVYVLPAWMEPEVFESLVEERLGELFMDVLCGDKLTLLQVRTHLSRQKLVYMTHGNAKHIATIEIGPGRLGVDDLLDFLVTSFCRFNERWQAKNRTNTV